MRRLLKRALLFLIPILVLMVVVIMLDPFKVFFSYEDPYKGTFITLNRENVVVERFEEFYSKEHYNSFILGNSRSQAYHCSTWAEYLPENARPFHFDANGEGIIGVRNKLNFLDKKDVEINNVLIVLDESILNGVEEKESHIYTIHPKLSEGSKIHYYAKFLKKSLNFKFLTAYIDYKIYHEKRDYMEGYVRYPNYHTFSPKTGDVFFQLEDEIKKDSITYYKDLEERKIFYSRINLSKDTTGVLEAAQVYLVEMGEILKRNNTSYKIVISPLYNQRKMSVQKLDFLESIFGKENIYNFSGKNDFNQNVGAFYEASHYRPYIANQIMKEIYK